jgi:hypothetical protein
MKALAEDFGDCGNGGARMLLDVDEQVRIVALNAAIAFLADGKAGTMHNVEMYARAFSQFIFDGEMPPAPAGVSW